jgi:uncharacterized protein (DUF305 family)
MSSVVVRTVGAATTALLAVTLAACGGGGAPEPGASPTPTESVVDVTAIEPHNDADVELAQMMIIHHRDAIAMAEMADSRSDDLDVLSLAEAIAEAQGPEIETMTGWLESWGEEVPAEGDVMDPMAHGADMPGAMSAEDMAALEAAQGEEFDRLFLTQMIAHHEGAIEMAEEHLSSGSAPAALALSQEIATTQAAEIETMQALLS